MSTGKILISYLLVSLLSLTGVAWFSVMQILNVSREIQQYAHAAIPAVIAAGSLESSAKSVQLILVERFDPPSEALIPEIDEQLRAQIQLARQNLLHCARLFTSNTGTALIQETREGLGFYVKSVELAVEQLKIGNKEMAGAMRAGSVVPALRALEQIVQALRIESLRVQQESIDHLQATRKSLLARYTIVVILTALILVLLWFVLFRRFRATVSALRSREEQLRKISHPALQIDSSLPQFQGIATNEPVVHGNPPPPRGAA